MERTSLVRAHGRWSLQTNKQTKQISKQKINELGKQKSKQNETTKAEQINQSTKLKQTTKANKHWWSCP